MRSLAVAIVVACLATAGCAGGRVVVPQLGLGPFRPGDPSIFEQALGAALASGHTPTATDPDAGRFVLLAMTDPDRETRFVVQCHRDGWITVSPQGARVEVVGTSYRMPPSLRREYASLILGLERGVPVVDR